MAYVRETGMSMQGAKYPTVGEEIKCNRIEPQRDMPQVEQSLDQLRQTADMIREGIGRLEERLQCVLACSSPELKECSREKEKPQKVQLALSLDLVQEQLADCCSRLVRMLQRLEI